MMRRCTAAICALSACLVSTSANAQTFDPRLVPAIKAYRISGPTPDNAYLQAGNARLSPNDARASNVAHHPSDSSLGLLSLL